MAERKVNPDEIKKQGIKLIEDFSKKLEKIPETEETHYVVDMRNVTREDKKPVHKPEFKDKLKKLAPKWEDDYVVTEKGV